MKKIIALLLTLCIVFSLCACAKDRDLNAENLEDVQTIIEPTATSEDVELYIALTQDGKEYVVNGFGEAATKYTVGEDGNIQDEDGETLVTAKNASKYQYITMLSFDKASYNVTLEPREETVYGDSNITTVNQYPVSCTVTLNMGPEDASNKIVAVSTSDINMAEIKANNNAKIIAEGAYDLPANKMAIDISDGKSATITVTAKAAGEVKIYAESLDGNSKAECSLIISEGTIARPEATDKPTQQINTLVNPTVHTHNYEKTVVAPQAGIKGYTLYTCAECGKSYTDNYTAALPIPDPTEAPHVHEYTAVVVAPTETERGYTLHNCSCGDSYKDSYVEPTGA